QGHSLVRFGDRVQPSLDAPHFEVTGTPRNVEGNRLRRCWKGPQAARLAPLAEVPPVSLISAQCVLRFGCPDELADLFWERNDVRSLVLQVPYRSDNRSLRRHAATSAVRADA